MRTASTSCPSPARRPASTGLDTSKGWPGSCQDTDTSSYRRWLITRTLEDFQSLDRQLHTCVYDRRYSQLPVIHQLENIANNGKVGV